MIRTVVQKRFIYAGDNIIADLDSSYAITHKYIVSRQIDDTLCIKKSSGNYYLLKDHLGSTDSSGSIVESYQYGDFGQTTMLNSSSQVITSSGYDNHYLFNGQEYEEEIDLYYYRSRFYHSEICRFLSPDPKLFVDGPNIYNYVVNNPLKWRDPFGLFFIMVMI